MRLSRETVTLGSSKKTEEFAARLGALLTKGDTLLLSGPIGAGKTHFARALISSLLKQPEDIPSPTFTLVQVYEAKHCEIWHADLYRLTDPSELVELGLTDAFEDAICLIEWPDRLSDLRPENSLSLTFSLTPHKGERQLVIEAYSPHWKKLSLLEDFA